MFSHEQQDVLSEWKHERTSLTSVHETKPPENLWKVKSHISPMHDLS